jgi:hypothetical protein
MTAEALAIGDDLGAPNNSHDRSKRPTRSRPAWTPAIQTDAGLRAANGAKAKTHETRDATPRASGDFAVRDDRNPYSLPLRIIAVVVPSALA